jgi:hypothetical protein
VEVRERQRLRDDPLLTARFVRFIDFAGNSAIFSQTCTGICYDDWVLGPPSNFDNAYFEVQYVRVYGQPGELTVLSSGATRSRDTAPLLAMLIGITIVTLLSF